MSTFPFFNKKPAALPEAAPPPPPPAPPVAVAPPPPPAPAPVATAYEARDPDFYAFAWAMFAAALQPPGYQPSDAEQANETGKKLAQLLDTGVVPKGCMVSLRTIIRRTPDGKQFIGEGAPEPTPLLDTIAHRDAVAAVRAATGNDSARGIGGARHPPTMTAAQLAEADRRTEWAGGKSIPTREDAERAAVAAGEALADLSESVRAAAFYMSWGRIIAYGSGITGARLQEAIDVVVAEVERARMIYAACGRPTSAIRSYEEAAAQGSSAYAWPVTAAIDTMRLAFGQMPDLSEMEQRLAALESRIGTGPTNPDAQEPPK